MTQFFRIVHWEKNKSFWPKKNWNTGGTKIWPKFLGQNDSIFSLSFTERKNESFWPKKIQSLAEQKFDPNFYVKMTQFFRIVHWEKNKSFWPKKNWNTGGTKIWPKFLGQNDSIFSLTAPREKNKSFWPKKLSYWRK